MPLKATQQLMLPYGLNINLAKSKKIATAAAKKAARMKVNVVITIVDAGGHLVYLERSDMAQHGSIEVAIHKAKCSVAHKRPTKFFEDAINDGRTALLTLDGVSTVEGGVPLVEDDKIIGAIGVSGAKSQEDGQIAEAGAKILSR
jgi:glc operon protein GlcG